MVKVIGLTAFGLAVWLITGASADGRLTAAGADDSSWGGLIGGSMSTATEPGVKYDEARSPWVEQVGVHPKAYVYHNFLTEEERIHLIRLAAPEMRRSSVVGPKGDSVLDEIRTSYGMFIRRLTDPVIERIERRISLVTHLPISHQEDIQVLRYTAGQKYGAHYDSAGNDGQIGPHFRLATFLMYLSDVEEGGETAFPQNSEWADPSIPTRLAAAGVNFSDCAKGHVAAKPKAGDAALFYSYHPNGTMDEASMHTGCPVIKGIKWAAPVWVHVDEYEPASFQRARHQRHALETPEPGMCKDERSAAECKAWTAAGECKRNKAFMVGDAIGTGACRRSCGACQACSASNDINCINDNRKKLGYLPIERAEMDILGVPWWYGVEPSPEL